MARRRRLTRDSIMEAALPLFRERGYRSTRLEDIASALGVTQPAIYDHFNSKEDILIEMQARWMAGIQQMVDGVGTKSVPASAKFLRLLAMRIERSARFPAFSCVAANELREVTPDRAVVFREHSKRFVKLLESLYAQAVADGEFLDIDPGVAVRAIFGAANSIHDWYRPDGRVSPSELRELFLRLLQHGFYRKAETEASDSASRPREGVEAAAALPR